MAQEGFVSGGASIRVERFGTTSAGRRPAVILLHGADGPGERYRAAARQVAAGGYAVFMVHYLDRTGERRASYSTIHQNLPRVVGNRRRRRDLRLAPTGRRCREDRAVRISLGGGLALATAAQDGRVRAVIDYFGFAPNSLAGARLPPTLVLHGDADRIVPVSNAYTVQGILKAGGTPHEVIVYPGEGHGFSGSAQQTPQRASTLG
jgi:carboxymethylenebutenolidase